MSGSKLDYAPTVNFKSNTPSLDTTLSTLVCGGNTGTAEALSLAYAQLQAMALVQPGAINVLVFFTDGQPNGLAFDLTGSNPYSILPIKTQSDSRYGTGESPYPSTTTYYTMPASSCSAGTATMGVMATEFYSSTVYATVGLLNPNATSISSSSESTISGTSNCNFAYNFVDLREDFAYMPTQDHWGNSTSGYKGNELIPASTGSPYAGQIRVDTGTSLISASTNAADNAAYKLRNDSTLGATVFTVGLGGAADFPVDQDFLERVANDPRASSYTTSQRTGQFAYAANINELGNAFNAVASTILRLSQ
jgi:hypothetical protein